MLVQEHLIDLFSPFAEMLNPAWIAGAKAGLEEESAMSRPQDWEEFLTSLYLMIDVMPEITAAEPGTAPSGGSLYEALGGYISVAGNMTEDGLTFTVPLIRQRAILSLFPGMRLLQLGNKISVPASEMRSFLNLVPLRGPIESDVEVL